MYTSLKIWRDPNATLPKDTRSWLYVYVDEFIISWLPLGILVSAALETWPFWIVLALHLLLFKNALKSILLHDFGLLRRAT